jgi:RecA/RadA recombinase
MFIGRSGCGKSTLVFQIVGKIIKQFKDAELHIDDIEGSLPKSRKENLLGLSIEEIKRRVRFRDTGITTESVFAKIKAIRDLKVENRAAYTYDTGLYDTYGNKILKLIPTVYLIDSFAMLMPEDIAEKDEIDSGMGATKIAKTNTSFIKKISQYLREANIILISVNHILEDVSTGFLPKAAQISGLKQGERLPGGKTALYIANNIFRLDDAGTLKASEGYGIDGGVVNVTIVKSRTNQNKKSVPLIFNKTEGGFDPTLSLFHFIKTNGGVEGAGAHLFFDNCPEIKFSQKEFKNILASSPELQKAFALKGREYLDPLLSDVENQSINNYNVDVSELINGLDNLDEAC